GSWLSQLTKQLGLDLHLKVILGLNAYFAPHDVRAFLPDRFPVFIHHFADPNVLAGGVPIFGQSGVKLIFDYIAWDDKLVDPPSEIDSSRLDALRAYANNILPSLDGNIIATDICRYTFT